MSLRSKFRGLRKAAKRGADVADFKEATDDYFLEEIAAKEQLIRELEGSDNPAAKLLIKKLRNQIAVARDAIELSGKAMK